ncbi:hypothetical protein [Nocardioides sp. GY 10127]|uniref:hypothetical protein n=1 Tax=Nocardioides sp. GY 10127 TaxID=2569762 RepID=UPI0010A76E5F|nr:hypothetical protein [Nocardioides sp. GY 10127]TIC83981.1 hypothetical protein E8D37_03975 [Nocardioides sp. GY 10127]
MPPGSDVRDWLEEDPDDDDTEPSWFPGHGLPEHARQQGLTHHTQEGALLDFAGRLDPAKPFHRAVAWVLLAVFCFPVLVSLVRVVAALAFPYR